MQSDLQPSLAESLCEVWAVLHKGVHFHVLDSELHYLTAMAMAADDDTVSQLLLKKLKIARPAPGAGLPPGTVRMNSYVEFTRGRPSERRFCQLVHPSSGPLPSYAMSITSLEGAGLIGLTSGQSILWPNIEGKLRDLHVIHVGDRPRTDSLSGSAPMSGS
jgi:regulator of nucleoside diphosphate kinase